MTDTPEQIVARAAFYQRAMREAADALAAFDPALAEERRVMAQPLPKEPRK